MSCGHDGCTCGPDQPAGETRLPLADHRASTNADEAGHGCAGHGEGQGGCCGGPAGYY